MRKLAGMKIQSVPRWGLLPWLVAIPLGVALTSIPGELAADEVASPTDGVRYDDNWLIEQVLWSRGGGVSRLVCQIRRDLSQDIETGDVESLPTLRCWVSEGDTKHVSQGALVFEIDAYDYPVDLQVISPRLLLCSTQAGTGQRHLVLDGASETPRVVVEEAGKGSMMVINGPAGEVALVQELFERGEWDRPDKARIFCWPDDVGELRQGEVPWNSRFDWLKDHCWFVDTAASSSP
ncbi:MAG: hypothetical protein BWK76_03530 [Desulfobulbaceae bacterium A2]|nr:MAG: hypothetical protein BWK76_03530 [Desulfobulbaceae bacterium A2]